jgi:hypothetical protein
MRQGQLLAHELLTDAQGVSRTAASTGKFTTYMHGMCGRVMQASPPDQLGLKIIDAP